MSDEIENMKTGIEARDLVIMTLRIKLKLAEEALAFYAEWETRSETAWSKHYGRTEINMNYPGTSKARTALAELRKA